MSDNVVHEWISESGHTHKLFSDGTIKEYMQPDYCIDTRRTHTTIAFARLAERVKVLEDVVQSAEDLCHTRQVIADYEADGMIDQTDDFYEVSKKQEQILLNKLDALKKAGYLK